MVSRATLVVAVTFVLAAMISSRFAISAAPAQSEVILIPGTVIVTADVSDSVRQAILSGNAMAPAAQYYAVTDLQALDRWQLVSVIGLDGVEPDLHWNLTDNGVWFGLVLLAPDGNGGWRGAVQGTEAFSSSLASIPSASMSAQAKQDLDRFRSGESASSAAYRFPWQAGTSMQYGSFGVHDNGFSGVVNGWKAVDFLSDGNTGAGHAPNRLLASAEGTISYKCSPSAGQNTTAIRIGDLMYTHLLNHSSLYVGRSLAQGDELGQMRAGSFSENCGWASQSTGWFHVHWDFPNTGSFQASGWTLTFADQLWRRGTETKGKYAWFLAEADPSWHAKYYANQDCTTFDCSTLPACESDFSGDLSFNWGADKPDCLPDADNWSALYAGRFRFPSGNYVFHADHDQGIKLWLDGEEILDAWSDDGLHHACPPRSLSGDHDIALNYREDTGDAHVHLWWDTDSSPCNTKAYVPAILR